MFKNEEHQPRSVEEEVGGESKGQTILKSFVCTPGAQPLKSLIRKIIHDNHKIIIAKKMRGKLNHNLYKCRVLGEPQKFVPVESKAHLSSASCFLPPLPQRAS